MRSGRDCREGEECGQRDVGPDAVPEHAVQVGNGADLSQLLGSWGTTSGPADIDGSGLVDGADLAALLGNWGNC